MILACCAKSPSVHLAATVCFWRFRSYLVKANGLSGRSLQSSGLWPEIHDPRHFAGSLNLGTYRLV